MWLRSRRTDIEPVWITQDPETYQMLSARGWPVARRQSLRGAWLLMRAGVQVIDGTANPLIALLGAGALRVNLWHGVGVKNVEASITVGPTAANYSKGGKRQAAAIDTKPDLIVTSSKLQSRRLSKAFQVPESQCAELGTPRLDGALDEAFSAEVSALQDYSDVDKVFASFGEVYIYMPTFRDSGRDFMVSAIPHLDRLNAVLKARGAFLFLKPHRKTRNTALEVGEKYENIGWWPDGIDFYPILSKFDLLITDYSSILFDFLALRNDGALLYPFDWDEYSKNDRDLAIDISEWAICERADNFSALCDAIETGRAFEPVPKDKLDDLRLKFWNGDLQLASPRIIDHVLAMLEARPVGQFSMEKDHVGAS
jgi:CDP-glycerol glycerophosphotransferase (TagB/SpsB family)